MEIRSQIEDYLGLLDMNYFWNEKEGVFELVFSERKDEQTANESNPRVCHKHVQTSCHPEQS